MENENLKFKIFYFVRYFADAFFYPFMSLYFLDKLGENSDSQLGLLLAITPIMTIVVNPIWTYFVKDMKISRIILQTMTVVEGVLIFSITQVDTLEAYAIIIGMIAALCSPYVSIQDGFAATFANNNKCEYSSIRIWASVSYVVATLIGGYLGVYLGYDLLFLLSGILFAATALLAVWIKPLEKNTGDSIKSLEKAPDGSRKSKRNLKALLGNVEFYKYLVFYTLVIGSVRIGDSFLGIYLTEKFEISSIDYGWLYAAFVTVEVLSMRIMMTKGSQISDRLLFILAGAMFVFRFLVYTIEPPLPVMFAVTLLRGASWGIILYAHIKFLIKIVRVENVTAAILIVTLLFSIFTGLGNFLSGMFIAKHGFPTFYLVNAVLIFTGLLVFIVFTPKIRPTAAGEVQITQHAESK
ncbi:MAG: MFS transporter [Candidatus Izemoplasmatales bacterium]